VCRYVVCRKAEMVTFDDALVYDTGINQFEAAEKRQRADKTESKCVAATRLRDDNNACFININKIEKRKEKKRSRSKTGTG
jgi:hypothetical protein